MFGGRLIKLFYKQRQQMNCELVCNTIKQKGIAKWNKIPLHSESLQRNRALLSAGTATLSNSSSV
jgi:hypothetical protein